MDAKRAIERAAPAPAPWQTISAAPATGTIIESGEWVYEIPWHAEDDLCDEDAHEWVEIHTHTSSTPIRTTCGRCGARRWPHPDRCVACRGRGQAFGYRCDPCGGTGRTPEEPPPFKFRARP